MPGSDYVKEYLSKEILDSNCFSQDSFSIGEAKLVSNSLLDEKLLWIKK